MSIFRSIWRALTGYPVKLDEMPEVFSTETKDLIKETRESSARLKTVISSTARKKKKFEEKRDSYRNYSAASNSDSPYVDPTHPLNPVFQSSWDPGPSDHSCSSSSSSYDSGSSSSDSGSSCSSGD